MHINKATATSNGVDVVRIKGIEFHSNCLKCTVCNHVLSIGGKMGAKNGKYYCEEHFKVTDFFPPK